MTNKKPIELPQLETEDTTAINSEEQLKREFEEVRKDDLYEILEFGLCFLVWGLIKLEEARKAAEIKKMLKEFETEIKAKNK